MAKKTSMRERLAKQRKELASRGKTNFIILKEGTLRVRIMRVEEEKDFGLEATQFYLGATIKGVLSPSTFGLPCAIMEKYQELKDSKKASDKELAKKISPRKRFLVPVIPFRDPKGKEVDTERAGKLMILTSGVYAQIIDHYLDEDDWGDFMDKMEGYDFKITRTGSGQFDTEYSVSPCQKTPYPKEYREKLADVEEMVKALLPTYEETQEKLEEFLNTSPDHDEEEEERPVRRKKKKPSRDLD